MALLFQRIFLLYVTFASLLLNAAPVQTESATVELISEKTAIVPGETFYLAVHFKLEPHWHIYWKNPGASGLALELDWALPEGFEAGAIQWPTPERILLGDLVNYGYEDEATLIVPIRAPEGLRTDEMVTLTTDAFWLICKEVCLPGEATLSLTLPVAQAASESDQANLFTAARQAAPKKELPWQIGASQDGRALQLQLLEQDRALPGELYFFSDSTSVVDPNAEQVLSFPSAETAVLTLGLNQTFLDAPSERLIGVLVSGENSWQVDVAIRSAAAASEITVIEMDADGIEQKLLDLGLPGFIVLAFVGGLILNIMPCVLPVLSLKVFSLLKHSGQSKRQAFAHGLAYTGGVVLSFVVLAAVLYALRAFGERVGWGFQLQNPSFVVFLTVVFFLFGLNLMGVFELGARLVGADSQVAQRKDILGSFGMGILAAVVGAPCMGPLVASVSGVAVQAKLMTGLLIFGTMGFGLASPFLLLSVFPKLVAYLPKPGVWMESFKQFMGFLLMAAVVFLVVVISRQGGVDAVLPIMIVLFFNALAAWIYGRWGAAVRSKRSQRIAQVFSGALILASLSYGVSAIKDTYNNLQAVSSSEDHGWQTWSRERVQSELAAGHPVFVDFTATWCLICQVNKKVALHTSATQELFERYGIVALEADWTRRNSAITDQLEEFGRSGVPLYLLYSPNGEITVLPQSLTNGIVREVVEKALK